jgi:plastocyanin
MSARRPIAIVPVAIALAGVLAGEAGASIPIPARHGARQAARPAAHPPARLLVYAQEWSLWPSRSSVTPGLVLVQLWNRGQDPHDVRIRALHHGRMTGRAQGVPVTASGRVASAGWRLAPGTYELYCSLAGHRHAGMRTRLVVR